MSIIIYLLIILDISVKTLENTNILIFCGLTGEVSDCGSNAAELTLAVLQDINILYILLVITHNNTS